MSLLFDRTALVRVGPAGSEGTVLEDIHLVFRVEKTLGSEPNWCEVAARNLSENTRSSIRAEDTLILEAGYESTELLFKGEVTSVKTSQQGPDRVTRIECGDGVKPIKEARLTQGKSFGKNTSARAVLDFLAQALGVGVGEIRYGTAPTFPHGYAVTGLVKRNLDRLAKRLGTIWSVQDGELQMLPPKTPLDELAVILAAETGLVGSPTKTEQGVDARLLLSPKVRPGRLVRVDAEYVKGDFISSRVVHRGDTRGAEWYTEIECEEPGGAGN